MLVVIIFIGIFLRLYNLGQFSLWMDEIFSMLEAQRSIIEIFTTKTRLFGYAPLHHFFTHLALYFGKSEFIVRFPAVVFGIATVYLIFKLGKIFFGSKTGLMAAFLLAISTPHLEYSREVRYYSYLIFFSSLTIFFLYKLVTEKKWRWLLLFFLMTILNIATQSTALLILLSQLIFLGIWFWLGGTKDRLFKIKPDKLFFVIPFLIVTGVFVKSFSGLFTIIKLTPAMPLPQFLVYVLESLSGSKFLLIFYLVFFLFGLLMSFRKDKNQARLLLLPLILSPLVLYFFRPAGFDFHIRYVIFILVPYLLIISYGIIRLLKNDINILIAAVLFGLLSTQPIGIYYQTKRGDWRGVGEYLTLTTKRGDLVVVTDSNKKSLIGYYFGASPKGVILKTIAEPFNGKIADPPILRFRLQHDTVLLDGSSNPEAIAMIDYKEIVSFAAGEKLSPMHIFISRPIWFWQEGETNFYDNHGWTIADYWGQQVLVSDANQNLDATVSYKIVIPKTGSYDFYANLRWDGVRSLIDYKFDLGNFSREFQPFYGEKGNFSSKWKMKEVKLGTNYLTKGNHKITFMNKKIDNIFAHQAIDYFYLVLND